MYTARCMSNVSVERFTNDETVTMNDLIKYRNGIIIIATYLRDLFFAGRMMD